MTRFLDLLRRCYRWFRVPIWLGLGLVIGFLGPYLWYLDRLVRAGFDGLRFDTPSRVYARAMVLRPGRALDAETLLLELEAARYGQSADAIQPGSYVRDGNSFLIQTRAFVDGGGAQKSTTVNFTVNAVNDPPRATLAGDRSHPAGTSGPQTVVSYATAINPGAGRGVVRSVAQFRTSATARRMPSASGA